MVIGSVSLAVAKIGALLQGIPLYKYIKALRNKQPIYFAPLQPKGKYEVIKGTPKSPDELVDMYEALISKYPAVVALIDPLRKEGYILNQTNKVPDLTHITTEHKGEVIIGTTCGEPCSDNSLSDVVVGLGVGYVKLGGLSRGEQLTKYNRWISIEEELAQQGILDLRKHTSPLFVGETEEQSST